MFSLPKARILRGYKAFSDILTRGKSITSGSIRLFYAPARTPTATRTGFSVSRSVRKAAVRNRIRRCLREAFRHYGSRVIPGRPMDLVLVYRAGPVEKSSMVNCKNLETDVKAALERLREKSQP